MKKNYFDLTILHDLTKLSINRMNNFNCQLVDKQGIVYDGFKLAQSKTGKVITVCNIDFQKSDTDKKYQARLIFRKTDGEFIERNVNKGSDQVIIPFRSGQDGYREFWEMIAFLYKWRETIDLGEFDDYFSITEKSLGEILPKIANTKNKNVVLKNLQRLSKENIENISNLVSVTKIKNIIKEWNDNQNNYKEEFWQELFQNNAWVLSQIFASPYLKIGKKFYCGGKEDDNKGGVLGDLQYKNHLTGNIAFVEIKTPKNDILVSNHYRGEKNKENSVYSMHEELTGGINQVLNQKKVYLKNHGEKNGKTLNNTKCILIIGVLPKGEDKKKSFELYRNSLRDVEIITYDELFLRIEGILNIFKN